MPQDFTGHYDFTSSELGGTFVFESNVIRKKTRVPRANRDDDSVEVSIEAHSSHINLRQNDFIRTTMTDLRSSIKRILVWLNLDHGSKHSSHNC
jgi:hypothetical protein